MRNTRLHCLVGTLIAASLLAGCNQGISARPMDPELAALVMPDPGPPAGRVLGEVLVRFKTPVADKPAATALLARINRRVHAEAEPALQFRLIDAVSGGNWRVSVASSANDVTFERALSILRAMPEIQAAEPDRVLQPSGSGKAMPPAKP